MYTIGQVSEQFGLPVSTLRYYDKEGLFPAMRRASGVRMFSEKELEALRVIECLKKSGMEIREIKQFMDWCEQGSATYPQRQALFRHRRACIQAEIDRMQQALDMLTYKSWYYDQLMSGATEEQLHRLRPADLPEPIRAAYVSAHRPTGAPQDAPREEPPREAV